MRLLRKTRKAFGRLGKTVLISFAIYAGDVACDTVNNIKGRVFARPFKRFNF